METKIARKWQEKVLVFQGNEGFSEKPLHLVGIIDGEMSPAVKIKKKKKKKKLEHQP